MAAETKGSTQAAQPAKKRKRAVRLAKATNVTTSLEPQVRARLVEQARAEGLELGHFLQKIIENHVVDSAEEGDALVARIAAKRAVIDHITTLAKDLDGQGKFDEHFVLTVMKTASADETFMDQYRTAIGGEGKEVKQSQKPLNQQLGRLIRRAVGARGMKTDKGTVARAQTTGEILTSYTLLTRQG